MTSPDITATVLFSGNECFSLPAFKLVLSLVRITLLCQIRRMMSALARLIPIYSQPIWQHKQKTAVCQIFLLTNKGIYAKAFCKREREVFDHKPVTTNQERVKKKPQAIECWPTSSLQQSTLGFVRSMGEEARGHRYRKKQRMKVQMKWRNGEQSEAFRKSIHKSKLVSSEETSRNDSKVKKRCRERKCVLYNASSPPCSPGDASVQHTEAEQIQQISLSR